MALMLLAIDSSCSYLLQSSWLLIRVPVFHVNHLFTFMRNSHEPPQNAPAIAQWIRYLLFWSLNHIFSRSNQMNGSNQMNENNQMNEKRPENLASPSHPARKKSDPVIIDTVSGGYAISWTYSAVPCISKES